MAKAGSFLLLMVLWLAFTTAVAAETHGAAKEETYSQETIIEAASDFFGATTKALAQAIEQVIEKVFKEQGQPNAYIVGTEGSGAIGIGLRYGEGTLHTKRGGTYPVYWQGPSIGFDFGGNFSKVFTLVYHLQNPDELFQRFPSVGGSLYIIAGVSVHYQKADDIILAPIRTGVGWRTGVSIGYVDYTRKKSWIPF